MLKGRLVTAGLPFSLIASMRTDTRSPPDFRFIASTACRFAPAAHGQTGMGGSYSTPPPASYSSGMTPVRTKISGGPQSPSSGSPVLAQAMTPAWVGASRAANARAEPADGQFGSTGTIPPSRCSKACRRKGMRGHGAGSLPALAVRPHQHPALHQLMDRPLRPRQTLRSPPMSRACSRMLASLGGNMPAPLSLTQTSRA
jgi:hypothetical protein